MKRQIIVAAAVLVSLAGCAPGQVAGVTAGAGNAVKAGQLFCAMARPTGPLVVALANVAGAPVKVTDQASTAVADACALVDAIPVVPPPNPGAAPIVATTTTLPTA